MVSRRRGLQLNKTIDSYESITIYNLTNKEKSSNIFYATLNYFLGVGFFINFEPLFLSVS